MRRLRMRMRMRVRMRMRSDRGRAGGLQRPRPVRVGRRSWRRVVRVPGQVRRDARVVADRCAGARMVMAHRVRRGRGRDVRIQVGSRVGPVRRRRREYATCSKPRKSATLVTMLLYVYFFLLLFVICCRVGLNYCSLIDLENRDAGKLPSMLYLGSLPFLSHGPL